MAKELIQLKVKVTNKSKVLSDIKEIREETTNKKIDLLKDLDGYRYDEGQAGNSKVVDRDRDRDRIVIDKEIILKLELVLYIDNREIRNQQEREYFEQKIKERGVTLKRKNLPVGDFLWVYELQGIINIIYNNNNR